MLRIPPICFDLIWLPYSFFDAPLAREDNFLPVNNSNESLLPPVTNHPFDIFQFKWTIRVRLTEVGEDSLVRPFGNRGSDHLVMTTIFPTIVIALVATRTLDRPGVFRLVDVRQLNVTLGCFVTGITGKSRANDARNEEEN